MKIFLCEGESHAEHDNSDDNRLPGEFVGNRVNKQGKIYPSHYDGKEKGEHSYGDYNRRCVVGQKFACFCSVFI